MQIINKLFMIYLFRHISFFKNCISSHQAKDALSPAEYQSCHLWITGHTDLHTPSIAFRHLPPKNWSREGCKPASQCRLGFNSVSLSLEPPASPAPSLKVPESSAWRRTSGVSQRMTLPAERRHRFPAALWPSCPSPRRSCPKLQALRTGLRHYPSFSLIAVFSYARGPWKNVS